MFKKKICRLVILSIWLAQASYCSKELIEEDTEQEGSCREENINHNNIHDQSLSHIDSCNREDHTNIKMTTAAQNYVTTLANVQMPKLIYGTAWKKDRTAALVTAAIRQGFRGVDTAAQKKHYNEAGVGAALKKLIDDKEIRREDIFLQTKFTSLDGQDLNGILPYDRDAKLTDQVAQSLESSLKNLGTTYIDSLVLHSPMRTFKETMEVWRTFESFVSKGQVRQLGLSNCYDLKTLTKLYDEVSVKPSVLQNRLYEDSNFDVGIREFAKSKHIYYQSFWTLSANPHLLRDGSVQKIARKYEKTPEQIFFAYLMNSCSNITPLTGTSNEVHMAQDLDAINLVLTEDEASVFDSMINGGKKI